MGSTRQRHNAEKRKRQEEEFFLMLKVQLKEVVTVLPKRSHTIIWLIVKFSKRKL